MRRVLSSREGGPDIGFGRPAFASFREPDGDCCENDHNIQNYLGGSDGGCSMQLCYRSKVRVGYSEHRCLSAEILLRFRITDYGVTPKSWRNAVIIFEVTSTLGIAAIAYAYPATRPIAGIYLIEEGIEETIEAYAGFWALDEVSRPVRIEAELITLDTGTHVWKSSATGLSDVGLTRLVRKVSAAERDAQLNSAIQEAAEKIVADLQKVLPQRTKAGSGEGRLIGQ